MTHPVAFLPADRAVIRITGEDRQDFLQGLISNDVKLLSPGRAIFSAFLTPQGKYLFDFMLVDLGDHYALDCEAGRHADLVKRLSLYRLRSRVAISDAGADLAVAIIPGGTADDLQAPGDGKLVDGSALYVDPRLATLGLRAILPRADADTRLQSLGFTTGDGTAAYADLRYALGVPEGSHDLKIDKAILLESGFDELHGVSWQKGCYIGQELTARTKYRGLVRKRLLPVSFSGTAPEAGTVLKQADREVGEIRSVSPDGKRGLALIRLEALPDLRANGLTLDDGTLSVSVPDWITLPAAES